jgi:bzd-type benzoyl-CoA reductase N subunit
METRFKTTAFAVMAEVAATLANPPLRAWKEDGGKVLGYFCSMVPEELLMAAGTLPFRMRATGSAGPDLADAYFTNLNCTFPRQCFSLALDGAFEFLDGLVCINSCDHLRRLYDNWRRHVPIEFIEFLTLPHQTGPDQIAWYTEEFKKLSTRLEQHFGRPITDDKVRGAITLANETRRLQRRLYQLRKQERPPITGAEALIVMVAGTAMPKQRYNDLLRDLLDELSTQEGAAKYRARVMIAGGILDDPAWVNAVEEVGALVVTDATCFGTRIMWEDVDEDMGDPVAALARHYLADRPSCPRLYDTQERRSQYTIQMCREFNCDGIIGEKLVFCDQWNVEHYLLASDLKEAGIPFLSVEREYATSGIGQLRTRVQAFIETMGK